MVTPPAPASTAKGLPGISLQTRLIAWVVAVTFFMENLDATVIAVALNLSRPPSCSAGDFVGYW